MGVVIRGRQADELEECVALLALVHKADGYPSNWPADPARWLTPRGMREAWVAVTGGAQIVGHVMVRNVRGDERAVSVSRFCVSPHFRGQGLGIKMLDRAREWALERGRLLVLEVDSGAVAAVRLYEREGWRRSGSYPADWTTPQQAGDHAPLYAYSGGPPHRTGLACALWMTAISGARDTSALPQQNA